MKLQPDMNRIAPNNSVTKNLAMLCSVVFILSIGTGIVAPLLAPYSKDIGATGLWVGLIYSGFYMVRFLLGTTIGKFADKYGPKTMLTVSMSFYPFIALSYFLADHVATLLGARLLHGVASAMMLPMAMTYIGLISPKGKEGQYMGTYNTTLFIANGAGPLFGGILAEAWGIKHAFLSLLFLAVISLVLTKFSLPTVGVKEKAETNKEAMLTGSNKKIWSNWPLLSLSGIYFVIALLNIFIASFFTLFAHEVGLSLAAIGFLISLNSIVIGSLQMPLGKLVDRSNKPRIIMISATATGLLLICLPFFNTLISISLIMILLGIAMAFTVSSSSALSTELGREASMGSVMGFLGAASSLGMIVGPLVSGWLADHYSIQATIFFSGIMWLVGALVFTVSRAVKQKGSTLTTIQQ